MANRATPPTNAVVIALREPDPTIIGIASCGFTATIPASHGMKMTAVKRMDHWAMNSDQRNGIDKKIGSF